MKKEKKPFNIYRIQQLKAIEAILTDSEGYFYRKICRWFSEKFNTPLMDVYKIPYPKILQEYYEGPLSELEYNDVYDMASTEYVPELADAYEEENQKFADSLIKEQEETLKRKAKKRALEEAANKPQSLEKDSSDPKELDLKFEDEEET